MPLFPSIVPVSLRCGTFPGWSGAGYEDWDRALDELAERGYDAARIDAYPHLHAIVAEIIAAACNRGLMVGPYQSFNNWHDQPDAVAAPEDKISSVRYRMLHHLLAHVPLAGGIFTV